MTMVGGQPQSDHTEVFDYGAVNRPLTKEGFWVQVLAGMRLAGSSKNGLVFLIGVPVTCVIRVSRLN